MKKSVLLLLLGFILSGVSHLVAQERTVEIYKDGQVLFSKPISEIDYLTVVEKIGAPTNLNVTTADGKNTITWSAVNGAASYKVYRSGDGSTFSLLGTTATTQYVDGAPLATNFYRVQAITSDGEASAMSATTSAFTNNSNGESGIYLGITGFNQSLYEYPVSYLTEDTKEPFFNFIDGLSIKKGTLLYYSVDQAISTLENGSYPSDIFSAAIITFTDGLDQGSFMYDSSYSTDEEYLDALNSRIMNEKVAGIPISAYSIGIRGNDVTDTQKFNLNLQKLASSPENAKEVTSMDQVNQKFKEIATQLVETSSVQTINLSIPGLANGTRIRFTFDNVTAAKNSSLYIEGIFNLSTLSLTDITYVGMTSISGDVVQGVRDGIFVSFTFDGVRADSKRAISNDYVKEWTYITSQSAWQINSEFDRESGSEINTEFRSAAIMLVLDCSYSLGSDFAKVQSHAKEFINTLCLTPDSGTGSGSTDNNDPLPSDNLSTTPIDLSLAVTKDGVRYYMTQDEYNTIGDPSRLGYAIDGVTVLSAAGSFIVALKNANNGDLISYEALTTLYNQSDIPTKDQGVIISARLSEINSALTAFGGNVIITNGKTIQSGNTWIYGLANSSSYPYQVMIGPGGYVETSRHDIHYFRPVVKLDKPMTSFPENNLKLAVIKGDERLLISIEEYDQNVVPDGYVKDGVYVKYPKLPGFIVELNNANPSTVNYDSAMSVYGSYLPKYNQGLAMSAGLYNINSTLTAFGGNVIVTNETTYQGGNTWIYGLVNSSSDPYQVIIGAGGYIKTTNHDLHYVRRVISCGDLE